MCGLAITITDAAALAGTLTGIVRTTETIPIGTILEHPEAYHLQIVHMEGIVQQLELLKPHEPFQPGDPCYGAYTFRLQDETGAIMVGVPGHKLNCGRLTGDESPGG